MEIPWKDKDGILHRSNPARDIAHCWPQLLERVVLLCHEENWSPQLRSVLDASGVVEDDVRLAITALCDFCKASLNNSFATPKDALTSLGFFELKPAAQLAVTSLLGEVCAGAFWAGIRSAMPAGQEPESFKEVADKAAKLRNEIWGK